MSNLSALEECFSKAFNLPPDTAFAGLKYRGIEAWDSLGHVQLVTILEETFDIMLDTDDIIDMSSFQEAIRILGKYGVEFS